MVVCVVGILVPKVPLNQLGADMKTRHEMVYDFLLALTPNFQAMYDDCMKDAGYTHTEAFQSTTEEIFKRAEKLADAYIEDYS